MHTCISFLQFCVYLCSVIITILLWAFLFTHLFMAGTCFPQNHSELLHAFPLFIYFNANYLIPLFVSTTLLEPIPALIINHNFVSPTMPRKKAPVAASPTPAMQESPSQPRGANSNSRSLSQLMMCTEQQLLHNSECF